MFGDPWPEEPDDPFPEYLNPFPEYSEPVPPRRPGRKTQKTDSESVPPALQNGMLALLAVVRIGVFALALGPMLVFLHGDSYYGNLITAIGIVSCVYAAHRYLVYRDIRRRL